MSEKIVDTEPLEDMCIAIRIKGVYLYCYPFQEEVWQKRAKIVTRTGKTVTMVRKNYDGTLTGNVRGLGEKTWDIAGRHQGPYIDSPYDLYIPERYFYVDWKDHMRMSSSEWSLRFGVKHPKVKLPEADAAFEKYSLVQEDQLSDLDI